jgi:flagellar motor switch protein FliG
MSNNLKMAGTLMMLIGEEAAAGVLRHLSESEIEKLSKQISTTGPIAADEAEKAAEDVYRNLLSGRAAGDGGANYARRVILRSLEPGPAKRIIDRLADEQSPRASGAFEQMESMDPAQLSQFLQNEHPQTVAVVLVNVSPSKAAALLGSFPGELKIDVITRMTKMDTITPEVIRRISAALTEKLKGMGSFASAAAAGTPAGGARVVAEVFNRMNRKASTSVLEQVEGADPEIANSIRQLMFIFDDIATLDSAAIRAILQQVDKKTIAQALKGASDALQQQFFRNMSGRAVEMMNEEMEAMGPLKQKDIHAARQRVIEVVRKLEQEGVINLGNSEEEA